MARPPRYRPSREWREALEEALPPRPSRPLPPPDTPEAAGFHRRFGHPAPGTFDDPPPLRAEEYEPWAAEADPELGESPNLSRKRYWAQFPCGHDGAATAELVETDPRGGFRGRGPCLWYCARPASPFVSVRPPKRRPSPPPRIILRVWAPSMSRHSTRSPRMEELANLPREDHPEVVLTLFISNPHSIRRQLAAAGYHYLERPNAEQTLHSEHPFQEGPWDEPDNGPGFWKRVSFPTLMQEYELLRDLGAAPARGWADEPEPELPESIAFLRGSRYSGLWRLAAQACDFIRRAISEHPDAYIAFSGGKDSTATLGLVLAVDPSIPIIWSDDELEYPETVALMREVQEHYGDQFHVWLAHPAGPGHGGWFRPWEDAPFAHEPLPGSVAIGMRMEEYAEQEGYELTFLGLRMNESRARARWLGEVGPYYHRREGWVCCPVWNWPDDAVLHLIEELGLPLNEAYRIYERIGVDLEHRRVGPLPLAVREHLAAGWPELLAALEARYGERWG